MIQNYILAIITVLLCSVSKISACKGCIDLDEISFEKIVPRFEAVLVKFDVAFPYGDKHETFSNLAKEVIENKDIILAQIGVKDYGEKDNEALAKKYRVTKDHFPAIKLFKKGNSEPISFPESTDFTLENLRSFVRDNTDIYLGLPGCIQAFDKLAKKFVDSTDKKTMLKETEDLAKSLSDNQQESAKTYVVIMKKIIESGKMFISQETDRVLKLLKGKISAKKQTELQIRLNILRAFTVPRKDEL